MKRIAYILALLLALAACSQAPTDLEPLDAYDNIVYHSTDQRNDPQRLDSAAVSGLIYVEFVPDNSIERVKFNVNDVFKKTEYDAPYTYNLDTNTLPDGQHKLVTSSKLPDGSFVKHRAYFIVNNGSSTPPNPEDTLWVGDMEEGDLSDWDSNGAGGGGEYNSGGGQSSASSRYAHTGDYSAKLTLTDVDSTQGVRLFRWAEPRAYDELYYSVWYYFPERYTAPDWWNIFQFKSKTSSLNDPFFLLDVSSQNKLSLYDWQERRSYTPIVDKEVPVGRWFQLEVFYKSRGDETGAITVWQDGVKLYDVKNVRTRYTDGDSQWSVNNYTANISPNDVDIYVDDAVISTTRVGN